MMGNTASYNVFPDTSMLAAALAEEIHRLLKEKAHAGGVFNMALSGGSTPRILFEHLRRYYNLAGLWDMARFYWVDERCVPPDHPESNYRMCRESMLADLHIPEDHIFRIRGEDDPRTEALRYATMIDKQVPHEHSLPGFDLVLLGMGEDGHTASIFPDRLDLLTSGKHCEVATHPGTAQHRITITGRIINNAHLIYFLISGAKKADILAKAMGSNDDRLNLPAGHIKPFHGKLEWYLDEEAAMQLK